MNYFQQPRFTNAAAGAQESLAKPAPVQPQKPAMQASKPPGAFTRPPAGGGDYGGPNTGQRPVQPQPGFYPTDPVKPGGGTQGSAFSDLVAPSQPITKPPDAGLYPTRPPMQMQASQPAPMDNFRRQMMQQELLGAQGVPIQQPGPVPPPPGLGGPNIGNLPGFGMVSRPGAGQFGGGFYPGQNFGRIDQQPPNMGLFPFRDPWR